MADDLMLGDTPKARKRRRRLDGVSTRGRLWKHSTRADLEGIVPADVMERLFTFTLVRNPWDRMVSYYCWLQSQRFEHPAVALAQRLEFAEFLCHPHTLQSLKANPASSYTRDSEGRDRCNLYIRLEHFQEDARPLFDHLGFDLKLPRVNQSTRGADWRPYFTEKTAEMIAQCCAEDIGRFEYSFNDFALTP